MVLHLADQANLICKGIFALFRNVAVMCLSGSVLKGPIGRTIGMDARLAQVWRPEWYLYSCWWSKLLSMGTLFFNRSLSCCVSLIAVSLIPPHAFCRYFPIGMGPFDFPEFYVPWSYLQLTRSDALVCYNLQDRTILHQSRKHSLSCGCCFTTRASHSLLVVFVFWDTATWAWAWTMRGQAMPSAAQG